MAQMKIEFLADVLQVMDTVGVFDDVVFAAFYIAAGSAQALQEANEHRHERDDRDCEEGGPEGCQGLCVLLTADVLQDELVESVISVCSLHIIVDTPGFIGVGTQIGNRDR
jgi:hypothetical protein